MFAALLSNTYPIITGCGKVHFEFSDVFAKVWELIWKAWDDPTIFLVSFSKLSDVNFASDAFFSEPGQISSIWIIYLS